MEKVFEGIRVIDFTESMSQAPVPRQCSPTWAAEVIKVERPVAGDDSRGIDPGWRASRFSSTGSTAARNPSSFRSKVPRLRSCCSG